LMKAIFGCARAVAECVSLMIRCIPFGSGSGVEHRRLWIIMGICIAPNRRSTLCEP
jgi:hypothetical protein